MRISDWSSDVCSSDLAFRCASVRWSAPSPAAWGSPARGGCRDDSSGGASAHGMPRHPYNPTSATPDMDCITQWFWLFLLLPVAALSGWVIGRRGGERHSDTQVSRLSTTYFRGLNYLLNEQPDKAIELFLHIAELDKDTFETQVALGHLFRRRGEVDRAIRLHQGLVQTPSCWKRGEQYG